MKARIQFDMYGDGRLTDLFHDEMSVANSMTKVKLKYPAYAAGTGIAMTASTTSNPFSYNGSTDVYTYDFDVDPAITNPMLYVAPCDSLQAAAVFLPLGNNRWRLSITAQVFVNTINLSEPYTVNGQRKFTYPEFFLFIGGYRG